MSYANLEASPSEGRPYFLYQFIDGAQIWRFTSWASDWVSLRSDSSEITWSAASLAHSDVVQTSEIERGRLEVTWPILHDFARRFLAPMGNAPVTLTIFRGHEQLAGETVAHWKGRVVGAEVEGNRIILQAESVFSTLRRAGVRAKYQRLCRHAMYGRGCNVDIDLHWQVGTLNLRYQSVLEAKQNDSGQEASVQSWLDRIWHQTFGSTAQAILKTKPFEFSAVGLSDLDKDGLKEEAVFVVQAAIDREGFNLVSPSGQQRALAVLTGFLNQEQQTAMHIEYYVWTSQQDGRVRKNHAERSNQIFRWDTPPTGGHPSTDFGCRCYARPLGVEGYWTRVTPSVDTFTSDLEEWEGNVDHMYRGTRGFVTVGKGKMLPDAASAVAIE